MYTFAYTKDIYIHIYVSEGSTPKAIRIYSEKDLNVSMDNIIRGLNNTVDWNARISSLQSLQGMYIYACIYTCIYIYTHVGQIHI
jgi:hypothetical protein